MLRLAEELVQRFRKEQKEGDTHSAKLARQAASEPAVRDDVRILAVLFARDVRVSSTPRKLRF